MPQGFQSTRWSLLQRAAQSDPVLQEKAWEDLHRLYQAPLLWFIRRSEPRWSREQAEDVLQSFFAKIAHREWLEEVDPEKGKMRTFLLSRLKTHIQDARKHEGALKRGGQVTIQSLDEIGGEVVAAQLEVREGTLRGDSPPVAGRFPGDHAPGSRRRVDVSCRELGVQKA